MKWTSEPPIKTGKFLWRKSPNSPAQLVEIIRCYNIISGTITLAVKHGTKLTVCDDMIGGQWAFVKEKKDDEMDK